MNSQSLIPASNENIDQLNNDMRDLIKQIEYLIRKSIPETKCEQVHCYMLDWNGESNYKESRFQKVIEESESYLQCSKLDYYWIEFQYQNKNYKISAFYKDYDRSTGNIHILPGPIQLWEQRKELEKFEFTAGIGCVPYPEGMWYPILDKPYFWNKGEGNTENEAKSIWEKVMEYLGSSIQKKEFVLGQSISSLQFYGDIAVLLDVVAKGKQIRQSPIILDKSIKAGVGHYLKYALLRWYNIFESEIKCVSLNEIKRYGSLGYFADYSKEHYYTKMYEHGVAPDSPWKAIWDIGYEDVKETDIN